jgi:hydrogenase nickel incorporation protein HypB
MCAICGCSARAHHHGSHDHDHDHDHHHDLAATEPRRLRLEQNILAKNTLRARKNRAWFDERGLLALNLVSSPGSGKTSLLERTITDLGQHRRFFVIQGDQATERDADRVRRRGASAIQLNTGTICHLDADMVAGAAEKLTPSPGSILAIENVGNLVCPALFDLGEHARIVVMSLPEGSDKPLKYPYMFGGADLILLNKLDLAPYVSFDVDEFTRSVRELNAEATILQLSATRGDGLDAWYDWLEARSSATRGARLERAP